MTDFPGGLIAEDSNATVRRLVLDRLAAIGYRAPDDAGFGAMVRLYQSQHVDAGGKALNEDGVVGRLTWEAMFEPAATVAEPTGLAGDALAKARAQLGVLESPLGSNRGSEVDAFQRSVGLSLSTGKPGFFWCMAFVHWCFQEAAKERADVNPFPRTASCIDAWNRVKAATPNRIITRDQALADPARVKPGAVFILDHGGGMGHTGFVSGVKGAVLKTIEGNSNNSGSRNGVGVFELDRRRTTSESLKGFIDFTGA